MTEHSDGDDPARECPHGVDVSEECESCDFARAVEVCPRCDGLLSAHHHPGRPSCDLTAQVSVPDRLFDLARRAKDAGDLELELEALRLVIRVMELAAER